MSKQGHIARQFEAKQNGSQDLVRSKDGKRYRVPDALAADREELRRSVL